MSKISERIGQLEDEHAPAHEIAGECGRLNAHKESMHSRYSHSLLVCNEREVAKALFPWDERRAGTVNHGDGNVEMPNLRTISKEIKINIYEVKSNHTASSPDLSESAADDKLLNTTGVILFQGCAYQFWAKKEFVIPKELTDLSTHDNAAEF
ncbi:hypothetical protein ACROYT_G014693 [Oculina patagonica]